jgi:peptidoglycan hydrolase CwlO-like protein
MKRIQALIAAVIVTALVGFGMLAIGVNAAFNSNSVPVSDSPASSVPAVSAADAPPQSSSASDLIGQYQNREKQYQAQITQLNNLIAQYQGREKQYQSQLNQVTTQAQQLQAILNELQRRGIIRIQSDGTILLRGGG